MNVKGGADSYHQRGSKAVNVLRHELLLLWRAQTNPNDVGCKFRDRIFQLGLLVRQQRSKWGCERSDNRNPRKLPSKSILEFICDARFSPVKKMSVFLLHGTTTYFKHQVGPKDAAHLSIPLCPAHPDKWTTVGSNQ